MFISSACYPWMAQLVVLEEWEHEPLPRHYFASIRVILVMAHPGCMVAKYYLFGGVVIARASELLESDLLTKSRITRDMHKDRIPQLPLPPIWQGINYTRGGGGLYSTSNWPRIRAAERQYLKDVESPDYYLIIQILRRNGGPPTVITHL